MRKILLYLAVLCALAASISPLNAAEKKEKNEIVSGVFINRIVSFDIKTGEAVLDFWYWRLSPNKEMTLSSLELCNGYMKPQLAETIKMEKDGLYYQEQRYLATVYSKIDLKRFPFDSHTVTLLFEDSNLSEDQMVFKPDLQSSGIDPEFQMNEWEVKNVFHSVRSYRYRIKSGHIGSSYSRHCIEINLARRGSVIQKLFRYFWPIFVSVLVGIVALFIRVKDLGPRFTMAVGSLFANVGCSYSLAEKLPKSPSATCAEIFSYVSLGVIIILMTESIISLAIYNHGGAKASRRLDFGTFCLTLFVYGAIFFWLVRM